MKHERIASECVCCGSTDLNKTPAILMPFVAHRVFDWRPVRIDASWGLKTITSGYAYSICNSLFCNNCSFLFLDIRFSDKELNLLYAGYRDENYSRLRDFYEPGYYTSNNLLNQGISYIDKIEQFLFPHLQFPVRLLDWGGDTGINSPFKDKSKYIHIYEISEKNPIEGASLVSKKKAFSEIYDLVICSNVLEHVSYPEDIILDIKKCMNSNTILYIEVPQEEIIRRYSEDESIELKKFHWHEHINFFSKDSLINLMEKCNLIVIDYKELCVEINNKFEYKFQIACEMKK